MGGAAAVGAGFLGSSLIGARSSRRAARRQRRGLSNATRTQQEMFERTQELLRPFVDRGTLALGEQGAFLGLDGPEAEQAAVDRLTQSPTFQSMLDQGEEAILANASATGGLRGGNTQRALATFAPQLLNQQIQTRLANLGDIVGTGANAAARTGSFGQNAASQIAANQTAIGQTRAGAAMATGQTYANLLNTAGSLAALSGFGGGGGVTGTPANSFGVLQSQTAPAMNFGIPGAGTSFTPFGPVG